MGFMLETTGLEAVGLDIESEIVYGAVLSNRAQTLRELGEPTGLTTARLRPALRRLLSLGLVSRSASEPARYSALDPAVALDNLLLQRETALQRARMRSAELTERFRQAAAGQDPAQLVEMVSGRQAILDRIDQIERGARSELRAFDKPPYNNGLEPNKAELDRLANGVAVRAIYEPASIDTERRLPVIQSWVAAGEQARVLATLPTKLLLADDRIGVLPLADPNDARPIGTFVVIHRSALLDALSALFEACWQVALPFQPNAPSDDPGALSDEDRLVISLMIAGLPDQAISRQVGISYRTAQRRIHALMARAQAETRFQFGLKSVALGWTTASLATPGTSPPLTTGRSAGRRVYPPADRFRRERRQNR